MGGRSGKGAIGWRFEIKPDPALIAKTYDKLAKDLMDWRPAWRRAVPEIIAGVQSTLSGKGGPLGEPWPALTANYAKRKARGGFGRQDLRRSGALRAQITSPAGVRTMSRGRLSFGTDLPYGRALRFGRIGKVAPRAYLGWTRGMSEATLHILNEHAAALMRDAQARIAAAGGR